MEYPITPEAFLTVAGVALFVGVVTQWGKEYLKDWRWTNIAALGLAEVCSLIAQFIIAEWHPTATQIFVAAMTGFFGTTVATYGYELIQNVRGLIGAGPRAK